MAKVIHYVKDDQVFCGTKSKTPATTEKFSEVTCKRCLKKMETVTGGFKSFEDKKHGYCLAFRNGNILKIGNDIDDEIGTMLFMGKNGISSTSMKISNSRGFLNKKEEKYLRNYFDTKKNDLGRKPIVSEVFVDFR